MITTKKQAFFKEKLTETIGKPKELWKSLKILGMPNKTVMSNFNAIKEDNTLTHDTRSISKIFKDFFSNLAEFCPIKFPKSPGKYNLKSISKYYLVLQLQLTFVWSTLLKTSFKNHARY